MLQNYTGSVEFSNLPSPFCSCIGCVTTAVAKIIQKVEYCKSCFCLGMLLIFHAFLTVTFTCSQFEVTKGIHSAVPLEAALNIVIRSLGSLSGI